MAKKKTIDSNNNNSNTVTALGQVQLGQVTEDAYVRFSSYCNCARVLPDLWGMKPSYRRLIQAALSFPAGLVVHTNDLVGRMSQYHPHSLTGIDDIVRCFTKKGIRFDSNGNKYRGPSVFFGKGNFGQVFVDGSISPAAANRYTSVRLSDEYYKIFGNLWKEVEQVESPGGAMEPHHIPLPVPLCLIQSESIIGIGVGMRTGIPCFSPISMYNALTKNDPNLLESNIDLILDKKKSQLQKLWLTGQGDVVYSFYVNRVKSQDGKSEGILFSGDTGMGTIKLNKKILKWVEEGKVVVDNVSDQFGPKMMITRVPNSRGITIDELEVECNKIKSVVFKAELNVTDKTSGFRIPLVKWLEFTYKDYINIVSKYNQKKINQVSFELEVQKSIPLVVEYLTKNPLAENDEIANSLNLNTDVISAVMSKPISYLRKKDTTAKIKELKTKLSDLMKFNPADFTYSIIQQL